MDGVDANLFKKHKKGPNPADPPAPPTPPAPTKIKSYKDLDDHDFEYNMKHKKRGVAVIINNQEFNSHTGMASRAGSSVDRDSLKKTVEALGFKDIRVKNNLTQKEMVDLMQAVASEDHKDRDCVFVAILSHGDENGIYGVDYQIGYEELMAPFKDSPSLVGKPKLFVVQACRGSKLDDGNSYQHDSLGAASPKQQRLSKESDFLIAYSVVPGYFSWRNVQRGSWFIETFCEVMQRDGRRLEFVELLTRVNRMVSYKFQSDAKDPDMTDKKQSPCITSMLTKKVYFS